MVPEPVAELARWFVEALQAEISELEKSGGDQRHELLHGRIITRISPDEAILEFKLAGGNTRVPEDSNGKLKTQAQEFTVDVISVSVDLIRLRLEATSVPDSIERAELIIDEVGLLRRLVEVLSQPADHGFAFGELASKVFHPARCTTGSAELPESIRHEDLCEKRAVLQQALGSNVTFIWGPPGTGKTFAIARLVTALVSRGERVLVTSHTKAAVDQALYETTKTGAPLATSVELSQGQILRLGIVPQTSNLPPSVQLDYVLAQKGKQLREQKTELETQARPLQQRRKYGEQVLAAWDNFAALAAKTRDMPIKIRDARVQIDINNKKRSQARDHVSVKQRALAAAERAWFSRVAKVARSNNELAAAFQSLTQCQEWIAGWERNLAQLEANLQHVEKVFVEQQLICERLPSRSDTDQQVKNVDSQLDGIASELAIVQARLDHLQQQLITDAKALFCTLTKNYCGDELKGQQFSAVIVDEISIALPPLIFLAAARASARVILVGDFMQLPPIVRSKNSLAKERLGEDVFRLAGIARSNKPVDACAVLTALQTQHRMRTPIANVARELAYGSSHLVDHESVRTRGEKEWLHILPSNPLLVVDTADLNSWCGRQAGSLSRFNFSSATVSVDLAALVAASLPEPENETARAIGIITPYAAQRRLIQRLVEAANLGGWVKVGTVHTFQGGEADLIIFDSVLDDPYWSARLTNPHSLSDVLRDINVAITRAREKFVFVGCSDWLNKHAKPESALGLLWQYLVKHADLVPALDLINSEFFSRAVDASTGTMCWTPPRGTQGSMFEKLDESNFFPRFIADLRSARKTIFALAAFFGEYRWPQVQPAFAEALRSGVEVTLLTPPPKEARNRSYVEEVVRNLRQLGAVVVLTSGLHGKDVIIDERLVYTGSMNWSSNRGRLEEIHRIDSAEYARICLDSLQARHIRESTVEKNGSPRTCPFCACVVHLVNQRANLREWERQPLKVGCTNSRCEGYLRPLGERLPLSAVPVCASDGKTKYRLAARGKGKVWQCPKHPSKCPQIKFVPGDAERPPGGGVAGTSSVEFSLSGDPE